MKSHVLSCEPLCVREEGWKVGSVGVRSLAFLHFCLWEPFGLRTWLTISNFKGK